MLIGFVDLVSTVAAVAGANLRELLTQPRLPRRISQITRSRLRLRIDHAPTLTLSQRLRRSSFAPSGIGWSGACAASFSAASKRSTASFQL